MYWKGWGKIFLLVSKFFDFFFGLKGSLSGIYFRPAYSLVSFLLIVFLQSIVLVWVFDTSGGFWIRLDSFRHFWFFLFRFSGCFVLYRKWCEARLCSVCQFLVVYCLRRNGRLTTYIREDFCNRVCLLSFLFFLFSTHSQEPQINIWMGRVIYHVKIISVVIQWT